MDSGTAAIRRGMDKGTVDQYKTIQRLQKNYLVRCGEPLESIIPGNGTKPVSLIRRIEAEIKDLRAHLGELTQEEFMGQAHGNGQKKSVGRDAAQSREALAEKVKVLARRLLELEVL